MRPVFVGWMLLATALAHGSERPRVGLALGGGSARGIAHVGVLEWLEENQIPVDFVAGTSMGGLIGGAFATGMPGADIRVLLSDVDWDLTFLGDTPYGLKSFRRKQDRREFPAKLELGLRGGLTFPSGLVPAHQIGLVLSRLALPYSTIANFDELPTPFRCIATDMERAEVVVLSDGSLTEALLATMAIPGIFPPLRRNDQVLSDGGLLNNVPTDVIPRDEIDFIIAVDVGSPDGRKIDSVISAASQAIDVMMTAGTRRNLERADVVITPDVSGVGPFDWRRSESIVDAGREAAEKHRSALLPHRLDDAEWARYLESRRAKTRVYDRVPAFVEAKGVDERLVADIERRLDRFVGGALDYAAWEEALTAITGTERYESLRYEELVRDGVSGLVVPSQQKSHAPPFMRFNIGLSNENQDVDFSLGARLVALDVGKTGAEVRLQGQVGAPLGIGAEYYYPLIGRAFFVAPRAFAIRSYRNEFVDDALVASRRDRRAAAGVDLGVTTRRNAELRVGYQLGNVESSIRVGDPDLPQPNGREELFRARFVYDGHNAPIIPTRGFRTAASIEWYEKAPDAVRAFGLARLDFSAFVPRGARDSIYFIGRAGASVGGDAPFLYDFRLGGPFRLSSFELDEFRGDHSLQGSVGYLREVSRLPDILGGPVYLTGLVEVGSAFDELDAARYRFSVGGGVVFDTAIGPLYAIVSGGTGGAVQFYFTLGRFFEAR